jgi:DNA topoisomerase-2
MNTPILKASKGLKSISFYNENEFDAWKDGKEGWKIKYYKGLGTSTGKEFKEYFKEKKVVEFKIDEKDCDDMDMLFNKKKAEQRKTWLSGYDRELHVDTSEKQISLGDFIHREMIHFSKYDCDRSIPNMMDGLKVSQRKILFSAFKRRMTEEVKVAQFSGYVSENSSYHHGEASLNGAIVHMAQDFVGSNNINLFMPNGQFGTRLQGGKDSASERYIFTKLNKITRCIFNKNDDDILKYLTDDGMTIEPVYYTPMIPMVLVNGTKGIGTGFSTEIPCFNPKQIIEYIRTRLENPNTEYNEEFVPYYRGFKGSIEKETETRFVTKGVFTIKKNVMVITELPIGVWNEDYLEFLDKLMDEGLVKDVNDMSTDKTVEMKVTLNKEVEDPIKTFKLFSYLSISNMNLFNSKEKLTHYNSVVEICDDFLENRLDWYLKRKEYMLKVLREEISLLQNKYNYIMEVLSETIDLRKKTTAQMVDLLKTKKYNEIDGGYNYLIKMTMDSVCEENVAKLKEQVDGKVKEMKQVEKTSIQTMWIQELDALEKSL